MLQDLWKATTVGKAAGGRPSCCAVQRQHCCPRAVLCQRLMRMPNCHALADLHCELTAAPGHAGLLQGPETPPQLLHRPLRQAGCTRWHTGALQTPKPLPFHPFSDVDQHAPAQCRRQSQRELVLPVPQAGWCTTMLAWPRLPMPVHALKPSARSDSMQHGRHAVSVSFPSHRR